MYSYKWSWLTVVELSIVLCSSVIHNRYEMLWQHLRYMLLTRKAGTHIKCWIWCLLYAPQSWSQVGDFMLMLETSSMGVNFGEIEVRVTRRADINTLLEQMEILAAEIGTVTDYWLVDILAISILSSQCSRMHTFYMAGYSSEWIYFCLIVI